MFKQLADRRTELRVELYPMDVDRDVTDLWAQVGELNYTIQKQNETIKEMMDMMGLAYMDISLAQVNEVDVPYWILRWSERVEERFPEIVRYWLDSVEYVESVGDQYIWDLELDSQEKAVWDLPDRIANWVAKNTSEDDEKLLIEKGLLDFSEKSLWFWICVWWEEKDGTSGLPFEIWLQFRKNGLVMPSSE